MAWEEVREAMAKARKKAAEESGRDQLEYHKIPGLSTAVDDGDYDKVYGFYEIAACGVGKVHGCEYVNCLVTDDDGKLLYEVKTLKVPYAASEFDED